MSDLSNIHSIAESITPRALSSSLSFTAGSASDSATWTGLSINRGGFSNGSKPMSMDAAVYYDATLGSGKTLSLTYDLQHSPDGATWADYATQTTTQIAIGQSGGGRVVGVARLAAQPIAGVPGVDLSAAANYIRCNVIPHLSATGTDTAVIIAVGTFGGFDLGPAPKS